MKKKSIFLFISMIVLGVMSTLGFFHVKSEPVYAESTTASVWDGDYADEIDEIDFYTVAGSGVNPTTHHILTAKGFGFFAKRVTSGLYPFINETVYLDCDIDLDSKAWTPIGYDDGHSFKGTFDGQGHYIYNLKISSANGYAGLFGTSIGSISNLNLKGVDINVSGVGSVGSIAGNLTGNASRNLSVSGTIVASGATYVGGVIGQSATSSLRNVSNIMSEVEIVANNSTTGNSAVGGVFGKYAVGNGTIEKVAFTGAIKSGTNATYVGGLVGQLDSSRNFKNSYNIGQVTNSGANTAGLIGFVNGSSSGNNFTNLYNAGKLDWKNGDEDNVYCAGLFGMFAGSGTKTIVNCLNLDTASKTVGSGKIEYYTIKNNSPLYRNVNNSTLSVSGTWFSVESFMADSRAVRGLSSMAQNKGLYSSDIFVSEYAWDFEDTWGISAGVNNSFPYLRETQNLGNPDNDQKNVVKLDGQGTRENPYLIKTAADLGYLSANYKSGTNDGDSSWAGKYYSLQNDIDLTGKAWQPIGASTENAFSGVFDGNGFAIYGMTCSLQFSFSYHGLFGVTKRAVIKNLEIKDVKFINVGTGELSSAGAMGSFIGSVAEETYLVNCVDNSKVDEKIVPSLQAVGKAEGNKLTVVYGKANFDGENISNLNVPVSNIAYDVELDGNGGTFYGEDGNVFKGTYRLMIDNNGAIIEQSIDESWGKNLPKLSEEFGVSATLIKKGSKLTEFIMIGGAKTTYRLDTSNFGRNNKDLILGLKARFVGQEAKTIKVVYNKYEAENFGATSTDSYVESEAFEVEYDSILSLDYPQIFNKQVTKDGVNLLRGDDFVIEDFYFKVGNDLFAKKVDETAFANDTYLPNGTSEVYVKWGGNKLATHTLNISFTKTDDPIYGRFDLVDAIASVSLQSFGENVELSSEFTNFQETNGKVIVSFNYDTTYSNMANNGLALTFKLKAGYGLAQNVVLNDFGTEHDFNFGHLAFGTDSVVSGSAPSFGLSSFQKGMNLRNLDEDYTIDVVLQRGLFETATTLSLEEVYFALAPAISNVSSVSIYSNAFYGDPNSASPITKVVGGEYLGYDVVNKQFVSGAKAVGTEENTDGYAFEIDMSSYVDILLGYTFDAGAQTRYFRIVKEASLDENATEDASSYAFYEVVFEDGQWKKIDLIVRANLSDDETISSISYLTGAEFSILGSVKDNDSDTVISETNCDNFGNGSENDRRENANTEILVASEGGFKKLRHDIKIETIADSLLSQIGIIKQENGYGSNNTTITLVSKYTKVSLEWKFVEYVGGEEVEISGNHAPIVTLQNGTNYEILESGTQTIAVNFTASDYYRLLESRVDSRISIVLSNGNLTGNENVLISAIAVATEAGETDNGEGWKNTFAAFNANYFGTGVVSKNGEPTYYRNATKTERDTYEFSLTFGQGKNPIRAGRYVIKFVCSPVNYSLNFDTQFVKFDENGNYGKDSFTSETGDNAPSVSAMVKDSDIESGFDKVVYNDVVTMNTALGNNKAYTFYDWYVESEIWSGFLTDLNRNLGRKTNIEFDFSNLYYGLPVGATEKTGLRDYSLTLSAVYIRKEIHILPLGEDARVSVAGQDVYVTARSLGIDITFGGFDYSYAYATAVSSEMNWNISFAKGGTNGDSYYFSGFVILNASNAIAKTISASSDPDAFNNGVFNNNYSIKEFVLDKLENDETLLNSTNYSLVPMLTRKTANLFVSSGTGEGFEGKYTDGKNGDVFYMDGENKVSTSNTKVEIGNVRVGDTINLNQEMNVKVDGVEKTIVIDSLYAERTGYSTPSNAYWNWSNGASYGTLNGSQLYIASSYFEGTSDDETSISLVLYRAWSPNAYTISFVRNQGLFEGNNSSNETVAVSVLYDQKVANALTFDDISRVGYALSGWTYTIDNADEVVFDADGQPQEFDGIFDAEGNYILTSNLSVYALWSPKTYIVELVTNGANTIAGEEAESKVEFDITYGTTFEAAFEALGLSGGENAPTREGFIYNGVYSSGAYRQTITATTFFSETLPSCVLREDGSASLTLFIDWQFDSSYVGLTFDSNAIAKAYTSSDVVFYIAEYFRNGYTPNGYNIEIVDDQTISITLKDNVHAKVIFEIVSESVEIEGNGSFSVRNVGQYNFSLVLSIEDLIIEGNSLYSQTINLYAQIDAADLNALIEDDNEDVWLVNVKRLMSKFVSKTTQTRLNNCNTFTGFVNNVLKNLDTTIPAGITNKQAYEFVAYKYYYMITSTDFVKYKTLTYADFEDLKIENPTDVANILERIYFFDFYDHAETSARTISMYNNTIALTSSSVENPKTEISIDRVEIVSGSLNVDTLYYFRAVIENAGAAGNLSNYSLNFDENGEAYIYLGRIYIMPELFVLEDKTESRGAYYNGNLINVSVPWEGDRKTLNIEGFEGYYQIDENLFARADLYTSNLGNDKVDTDFDFVSDDNYLYFANVSIFERSTTEEGETAFTDVTNKFMLVLDEGFVFTILNIDGVASVEVSTKYLSSIDGFMDFTDLPSDMPTDLLKITQVTYDIGGGAKRISNTTDGLEERSYEDGGNVICQIERNNNNTVSIILSKFVLNVSVVTSEKSLSDYLALYKWAEAPTYSIDGTMENNTSYTIDKSLISSNEGELMAYKLYAVYTDMVFVSYNLNFPSNYSTSSPTSSWLKLGQSTVEELLMPSENGFKLASLVSTKTKGSYETLFDSTDGKFKGLSSTDRHAKVELEAKWEIEEIDYEQILTEYKTSVYGFDYLAVASVVNIHNKNEGLFNYTYEWYKDDKLVSKIERLTLAGNGTVEESGLYKLVVTANVKKEFLTSTLVSDEGGTQSFEVLFDMEFIKNQLRSITFVGDTEIDYDAADHKNGWYVTIEYAVYDSQADEYSSDSNFVIEYLAGAKNLDFVIRRNGVETTSMKNAGTYIITAKGKDSVYSNSSTFAAVEFEVVINPYVVQLSEYEISFNKAFNGQDGTLVKELYLANENVSFTFARAKGENVGNYDLTLSGLSEDKKDNYLVKMNGVTVFSDGKLTTAGATTSVGTFEITTSGTLTLFYEVTDSNPETIEVGYSADGYRAELDGFSLKLFNGESLIKSMKLYLYDEVAGEEVYRSEIMQIVTEKFANVKINFFDTELHATVVSSGTYTYSFTGLSAISNCFSSVVFRQGYQFVVGKILIDTTALVINKTYDGKTVDYFTPNGDKIEDIDSFDGVYIYAEYENAHVGQTRVDFSLRDTNDSEEVSNYQLSEGSAQATISKLSARLVAKMDKDSYEYGEISISNLDSHVDKNYVIVDVDGNDVSDLLASGYYSITYAMPSSAKANANGYIYKGRYKLQAVASFDDFNMTLDLPFVEISAKQIEKGIAVGQFSILSSESVPTSVSEIYTINETGDDITILYTVVGLAAGSAASVGFYDVELALESYLEGSVVFSIDAGNQGFEVKTEDNLVYISLDKAALSGYVYNGLAHNISVDLASSRLVIENNGANHYVAISFALANDGTVLDKSVLSDLEIFSGTSTKAFVDAGTYRLSFKATAGTHSNFAFKEEYNFVIAKREIDASTLDKDLTRTYSGVSSFTIDDFDGKIGEDGVSLVARFESANAGENIPVTIFLQGAKSTNYELKNAENLVGTIEKAEAYITLTKTSFTYGNLTSRDGVPYSVISGGFAISSTQYKLSLDIVGATYSSVGYLECDNYLVSLAEGYTSANYNLHFTDNQRITVDPLEISVALATSGQFTFIYGASETTSDMFVGNFQTPLNETISLRFTREEGQEVGYYKVLSATSTSKNYVVSSTIDRSEGAFRISKAQDVIYILMSNADKVAGADREIASITYDGNLYDKVSVAQKAGSKNYQLVFESTAVSSAKQYYDLNYYTYDADADEYTRETGVTIDGLKASIEFANGVGGKNAGEYLLNVQNASADNFSVVLGKYGLQSFYLNIGKRDVYFLNSTVVKVFDNQDAEIVYNDVTEMLGGVLEADLDELALSIRLTENGKLVKYVGYSYVVSATLNGGETNYNLHMSTASGEPLIGQIHPAELTISVDNQTFVYGEEIRLDFDYSAEIDLNRYEKGIDVNLMPFAQDEDYSTSGSLRVGDYEITCVNGTPDFRPVYVVNGNPATTLENATVTIVPRTLTLEGVSEDLETIFTKTYDGEKSVLLVDEEGHDRIRLVGVVDKDKDVSDGSGGTTTIHAYDDVVLADATYQTEFIGQSITITFTLGGTESDYSNYTLAPYEYGVIEAVVVGLNFNYNANGSNVKSNVETSGLPQISSLAFPFMSDATLSANSANANSTSTRCFPTNLTGRTGYAFKKWTMSFKNIAEGSSQYNYLNSVLRASSLEYVYADDEFKIDVSNNAETVAFLKTLLNNESNVLGTYYKNTDQIVFTFDANWDINSYQVSIKVADEKGADATFGKVILDAGDGNQVEITSSYSARFDYGTKLTLLAVAEEHCSYYGFYNATGSILYDNGTVSGVVVSKSAEGVVLTVNSLGATYGFVARFEADKVEVDVDLSGATDASISSKNFVEGEDHVYSWRATYLQLESFTLADIGLNRDGFTLTSISAGDQVVTDLENTKLSDLVSEGDTKLLLTPNFVAVGVVVTLDFADGVTTNKNITVPFKSTYSDSEDWIETPERTGYKFDGWFDASDKQITGTSVLSTVEKHTLTARWTILNFDLAITAEHVSISSSTARFVQNGNVYTLSKVDFNTEVTFTVTADTGYELSSEIAATWCNFFETTIANGVVTVTLHMPAQNIDCVVAASPILNTITIEGDNIDGILAYETTDTETSIPVDAREVKIETGKTLKLVVTAEYGYQMIEDFVCLDADAQIDVSIESDILTLTITNILRDLTIKLSTLETINDVTIKFADSQMIEDLMVGGYKYSDFDNLKPFRVVTGENLEMYLKFKHGYEYDTCETIGDYNLSCTLATDGFYADEGYYKIVVTNIENDGQITFVGKLSRFTLKTQVLSYNENKQLVSEPANKVTITENSLSSIEAEFGTRITLTYQMHSTYNFAGWSKDGVNIFSTDETLVYTIEDDETIYAIFSSMKFTMRFATFNNYHIYSEYGNPAMEREIYQEVVDHGEKYIDADTGEDINSLVLYYGASKTISYVVPTGYRFYGFGYHNGERFVMLDVAETDAREASFTISSVELDDDIPTFVLYVIVKAYSFNININTEIDIDGIREPNVDAGGAELQGEHGEKVNAYGYIDGTRTRYSADNFVDGQLVDDRAFRVIGYTGETVYIKVSTRKVGYRFLDVVSESRDVTISQLEKTDTYAIYSIAGAIGGTEVDIDVLFRPTLNDIKIGFKLDEEDVDGGAITYAVDAQNKHKVFASGRDYSSITVAAYTDSTFEVIAYVRSGFFIDPNDIRIACENDIIVRDSVEYSLLSVNTDGYTGKLRFVVRDYLFENKIFINLSTSKYTVKLVEEGSTLAIIKNVEFGSRLNLYQANEENIQIADSSVVDFVNGKLEFLKTVQNYRFEGFFTSENGAGTMYIDASGNVIQDWYESGYKLNNLTSKYELTDNAKLNPNTGEMEITLYVYWSFYKTRIRFNFVPDISTNITAQDMIFGVDYTNSWFYPTSKHYIEVAFNTSITIKAPTINGYKFYKFVIKQRDINGNLFEDELFSNEIPWSTNELDGIVECEIQVVYFAKIDAVVYGGVGDFHVEQSSSDAQASALVADKYVDTTKAFKLVADFDENDYDFVRWNNITSGQSWWAKEWDGLHVSEKTTLVLNLQGRTFNMTFVDTNGDLYDYTFGQVLNVITTSTDNNIRAYRLGYYSAGKFISSIDTVSVKVGDKVTFAVSVDYGFAVVWDRDDITFSNYTDGISYFDMEVKTCPQDGLLRILPKFRNEIISIYINRDFVKTDKVPNTIDMNFVDLAGYATFGGKTTDFVTVAADIDNITIGLVTNARYMIRSLVVKNYDKVFDVVELFTDDKGNIVFTRDFLDDNDIVGSIQIDIKYERLLWENFEVIRTGFNGSGTDDDPYEIASVEDLVLMMKLCNSGAVSTGGRQYRSASYILLADIDLSEMFWTPIGTIEYSFNGYFNFNGHKVSGIFNAYIFTTLSYGGLFGVLSPNAVFVTSKTETWYIYLIVGIVALLVIVIVILIILAKRRKKRREKLATK